MSDPLLHRSQPPGLTATHWLPVMRLLLVVQAMLVLPVVLMLPTWLVLLPIVTWWWQWQVIQGRQKAVSKWLRALLVVCLPMGLLVTGLHPGALDFYVSLAFIGVALKLLEVRRYRDVFLVVHLALFVLAAFLLMDQGLFYALYVLVAASLCLAALIRLHAPHGLNLLRAWRTSGKAVLLAFPFMLALFVVFPRLPPLWQMPGTSAQAQTGLSDTMAPGEIAELVQNNATMFRARFDGHAPDQSQLYWRAMTLNHFDGERWYQWGSNRRLPQHPVGSPELPQPVAGAESWSYELVLTATRQPWIATLEHMTEFQSSDVQWLPDNRLIWPGNLNQTQGLRAQAHTQVQARDQLSDEQRTAALQLPEEGNEQARLLAQTLTAAAESDLALLNGIMDYFGSEQFVYTLRPGVAQSADDAIDHFLFDNQAGFCAHYAEAMVFLARAAGIPARVVTGYLGGRWSEDGSYLVVRAQEAHAWVEAWVEGAGWQRFDPTGRVAPERVYASLSDVLTEEADLRPASWSDATAPGWLQRFYWRWDQVQFGWQRWVLNFDANDQSSLLARWFGALTPTSLFVIGVTVILSVFGVWYATLRFKQQVPVTRLQRLEQQARRHCLRQMPDLPLHEGLTYWVERLRPSHPELAVRLAQFARVYLPMAYGKTGVAPVNLRPVKASLRRLKQVTSR